MSEITIVKFGDDELNPGGKAEALMAGRYPYMCGWSDGVLKLLRYGFRVVALDDPSVRNKGSESHYDDNEILRVSLNHSIKGDYFRMQLDSLAGSYYDGLDMRSKGQNGLMHSGVLPRASALFSIKLRGSNNQPLCYAYFNFHKPKSFKRKIDIVSVIKRASSFCQSVVKPQSADDCMPFEIDTGDIREYVSVILSTPFPAVEDALEWIQETSEKADATDLWKRY